MKGKVYFRFMGIVCPNGREFSYMDQTGWTNAGLIKQADIVQLDNMSFKDKFFYPPNQT